MFKIDASIGLEIRLFKLFRAVDHVIKRTLTPGLRRETLILFQLQTFVFNLRVYTLL